MLSQTSIRSGFSVRFTMMTHYTCLTCGHMYSGPQELHFSQRKGFRNHLHCSKCHTAFVHFGGSRPTSRVQTFGRHETDLLRPNRSLSPSEHTVGSDRPPSIKAGLPMPTAVTSSNERLKTKASETKSQPKPGTSTRKTTRRGTEKRLVRRRLDRSHLPLGKAIRRIINQIRKKLLVARSDLVPSHSALPEDGAAERNNDALGVPVDHGRSLITDGESVDSGPRSHELLASQATRDGCTCAGRCLCSDPHPPAHRSEHGVDAYTMPGTPQVSTRRFSTDDSPDMENQRPESAWNMSQQFLHRLNRFSRSTMRESYSSVLTLGSRSRSRHLQQFLAPQNPHSTATRPSTVNQGNAQIAQPHGSVCNSAVNMSTPRPSHSNDGHG